MSVFSQIEVGDEIIISRPDLPQVIDIVEYVSQKRLVTRKGYKLYFEDNFQISKTGLKLSPSQFGLTSAFWSANISPAVALVIEEARIADLLVFPDSSTEVE